jgi:hypothetical protein
MRGGARTAAQAPPCERKNRVSGFILLTLVITYQRFSTLVQTPAQNLPLLTANCSLIHRLAPRQSVSFSPCLRNNPYDFSLFEHYSDRIYLPLYLMFKSLVCT